MRAFVITIMDMPQSVEVAQRCIDSGAEFGVKVEMAEACTPADMLRRWFRDWDMSGFDDNPYSRQGPCMAAFSSHAASWFCCAEWVEDVLILEHDAVFVAPLPDLRGVSGVCNLGKPSFGEFKTPPDGLGPLVSKPYFGGAHGYYVTPHGAEQLLARARTDACPTDVFLSLARFPWLTEYHPWPIVCDDSFSTIQKARGCEAKHNKVTPC
jgi:GR25 family glycosyltransferase involved in LPS biosynthesis